MDFSNSLLSWYLQNKRELPWRNTNNPYIIWISEIILQQTKVNQGLPYFLAFVEKYPTVFDFANAKEEEILILWQGLGYYSRARNMHKTAKTIVDDFNGIFPSTFKELLLLKGIGPYTAAAIASFCFNEVVPVVDGNVYRVLARYFGISTDISSSFARKEFFELANSLISQENPAIFNQAIMEFGAMQCVFKNPNCNSCIFSQKCVANLKRKVENFPVKTKKINVKTRYLNYLIFTDPEQNTMICKRKDKDIWQNLYEFPVIETKNEVKIEEILKNIDSYTIDNEVVEIYLYNIEKIVHKLTHQKLYLHFFNVSLKREIKDGINIKQLEKYPFPVAIYNFITKYINS